YKFEGNALAWWKAYKQAKGGDAWLITVTWAEFKKLFFLQFFPRAEQERLKREYHSIRQTNTETSTEFMQRFLRLDGFLGAAAAQVANAARNYEILHERDDDDAERPDKRQKSGDWHQPTSQQSSHRNHGHNNDRHGSDMNSGNGRDQRNRGQQSNRPANSGFQQSRGPSEGYSYPVCTTCGRRHPGECRRAAGTCFKCGQAGHLQKDCNKNTTANTSGQADKKPGASGRVFAITEDHATKTSGFQQSRGPSEGYSYPVCTTCGRRHPGECCRAVSICFKCGQADHLQKDCKKNTTASTSGQADKKPGASGRVFAITEDHATKTSATIIGTLFIYGHEVFVLFDTDATHSIISFVFASRVTTTTTLLDHVLCISTPIQDSVRITHVYRDLPLQFYDKIRAINALPLDMCEFDIILGMDWLTEHHATIDCRSYRVIFDDIHAPEFSLFIMVPFRENLCRSFPLCKHV
nr:hypothetical protein [Tanacetum cinerariifolium]